ncbi:MAG: VOC family protein [Mariprofundaceae bacterium]
MRLHHVALIVSDLERSAEFYEGVLGLERELRPDLGFPGLFYGLGSGQQIHLMQIDNPYDGCELPDHGGRDFHVALATDDLDDLISKLEVAGIIYSRSRSGRAAIFFRDPDGNAIEMIKET